MEHPVACLGFFIDDGRAKVFVAGDTGLVEGVKAAVRHVPDLSAVVLEVSWPSRMAALAESTGHVVPSMLKEHWPVHPSAQLLISHIKPFYLEETVAELMGLMLPATVILDDGMEFEF
jgi:hypothetical protein